MRNTEIEIATKSKPLEWKFQSKVAYGVMNDDIAPLLSTLKGSGAQKLDEVRKFSEDLEDNTFLQKEYQKLLEKHIGEFMPFYEKGSLSSALLCPSHLEGYNVRVPTKLLLALPLEELVDEYFGAIYQPRRWRDRYQDDFKKAIEEKLSHANLFLGKEIVAYSLTTSKASKTLQGLQDIYGDKLQMMWEKASPKIIAVIESERPELYEQLQKKFSSDTANPIQAAVNNNDIHSFIKHIDEVGEYLEIIQDDRKEIRVFQKFLNDHAEEIGKVVIVKGAFNHKHHFIFPSSIHQYGIKVPTKIMAMLNDHEIADELFGVIYQPSRLKERFDSDFDGLLKDRMKHLNVFTPKYAEMLSVLRGKKPEIDALVKYYGKKELQAMVEKMPKSMVDQLLKGEETLKQIKKALGMS